MLAVVYLIFNEGYGGRGELAGEAIRLGRALAELMPDEPEVARPARADAAARRPPRRRAFADGDLVLLADQDRSLWDAAQIDEGRAALDRALALQRPRPVRRSRRRSPSLHAEEPRDWPQIAALYGELARRHRLAGRRAEPRVALAEARRPRGRTRASSTASSSTTTTTCTPTRGELLRRLGRPDEAREPTRRALALVHADAERRLLARRLAELRE